MESEVVWEEVLIAVIKDISELKGFIPYGVMIGAFTAVICFILYGKLTKSVYAFFAASYISLIVYRCFLNRVPSESVAFDLQLGQTIKEYTRYHFFVDNILLFVPAGIIGTLISDKAWKGIAASLLMSLCIEVIQLMTRLGAFHADDLLANTLGAIIGTAFMGVILKAKEGR